MSLCWSTWQVSNENTSKLQMDLTPRVRVLAQMQSLHCLSICKLYHLISIPQLLFPKHLAEGDFSFTKILVAQ